MKKIILPVVCCLVVCASCKKDFLDAQSPSEYTQDLVFSSLAYTDYAVTGTYALLTQDQLYSARLPLTYSTNSDIEIAGADAGSYNNTSDRGLSNYMGTPNNTRLNNEWSKIYAMIERANLCIEGIRNSALMQTSDSTAMKAYLGEMLTLRALGYFELARHWGDVPFKKEPTSSDLSNVYLAPTDRDEIYDQLIADLEEAEGYLPWVGTTRTSEWVTKGFAKGLLARIALTRGGYSIRNKEHFPTERGSNWEHYYELAHKHCDEIIKYGPHRLNSSYLAIWKTLCQLQLDAAFNENMFEVANGLGRSGEMGYSIGIRFYANSKYGYGNNANVVNTTAYYFYSFDPKDTRRDITVAYYTYSNSAGDVKEVFQTNPLSFNIAKWDQRFMSSAWSNLNMNASGKIGYGINWVLMRYADVLLMFAETENELYGPTGAAKNALKEVRRRAFAQEDQAEKVEAYVNNLNDKTAFFNAIVNERAWEFGGEAIRKYDLIRWNLLVSKIEEQRTAIKKMLNREAPYNTLPTSLFYKYEANNEIIDKADINFFEDKGNDNITGYTKIAWLSGASLSNRDDWTNRINLFSSGLNADGVTNRHLYPIHGSIVSESQGKLVNSYEFK